MLYLLSFILNKNTIGLENINDDVKSIPLLFQKPFDILEYLNSKPIEFNFNAILLYYSVYD